MKHENDKIKYNFFSFNELMNYLSSLYISNDKLSFYKNNDMVAA